MGKKKRTFHNCLVIHFSFRNKITFISKFWFRYTLCTYGCMCAYMYVCMHSCMEASPLSYIQVSLLFESLSSVSVPKRSWTSCISAYLDGMAGLVPPDPAFIECVCLLRQGLIMYPDMISTLPAIFP